MAEDQPAFHMTATALTGDTVTSSLTGDAVTFSMVGAAAAVAMAGAAWMAVRRTDPVPRRATRSERL
jgi:hypothetical protein